MNEWAGRGESDRDRELTSLQNNGDDIPGNQRQAATESCFVNFTKTWTRSGSPHDALSCCTGARRSLLFIF